MDTSLAMGLGWEECIPMPPLARSRHPLGRRGTKPGEASRIPSKNASSGLVETASSSVCATNDAQAIENKRPELPSGNKANADMQKPQ